MVSIEVMSAPYPGGVPWENPEKLMRWHINELNTLINSSQEDANEIDGVDHLTDMIVEIIPHAHKLHTATDTMLNHLSSIKTDLRYSNNRRHDDMDREVDFLIGRVTDLKNAAMELEDNDNIFSSSGFGMDTKNIWKEIRDHMDLLRSWWVLGEP